VSFFARYIGIDYSGAATPNASLKGLRVYLANGELLPVEVPPPPSARKYWTRRGIAEWLTKQLAEDVPTLVGIDHGFSFPLRYFEVHRLQPDWSAFLDDFQRHWPTDENIYVDFVRDGLIGNGSARTGSSRWRRLTEEGPAVPNQCSISTCRGRWRSPPTPEFPGCASFGSGWASAYTFGHSMVGTSRWDAPLLRRSIPGYGTEALEPRTALLPELPGQVANDGIIAPRRAWCAFHVIAPPF
jgi:hypothetical protein